jgi:hypothetical protein
MTLGDDVADRRGVITFGRAEERDRPRPLGERAGEIGEFSHVGSRNEETLAASAWPYPVTPAKAGGQGPKALHRASLDPRFRGDDE